MQGILVGEYQAFVNMANKTENFYSEFIEKMSKVNGIVESLPDCFEGPIADNVSEQWRLMYDYYQKLSESEMNGIIDGLVTIMNNYINTDSTIS